MAYLPITAHGLVGDLHTAGLIGVDGRLVWLPWPHFASPSLFAAILDDARGGDWLLAPAEILRAQQSYHGETAILVTTFETPTGRAELWDWMSPYDGVAPGHDLCRQLRCVSGEISVRGRFAPRPDYARRLPELIAALDGLQFSAHDLTMHLRCNRPWQIDGSSATLATTLRAGEELSCVLCSGQVLLGIDDVDADLAATTRYWQTWLARCRYEGRYAAIVRRSAITLKLLTYAPSGAIVAAPTTSLPEWIGGMRNWDYRYTWLRDASFTLYGFYLLGFREEARAFFGWLNERARQHGTPLQLMYGIDGQRTLDEFELPHLEGYRGSRPVRIGNAAYHQLQLDAYGGVLDAALLYERHGDLLQPHEWDILREAVDYVCAHWQEPDNGIWEVRGPPAQHTFSKLMCWVTVDRGIRIAEQEGWAYDAPRWQQSRAAIRASIEASGWNPAVGAFTMTYGSAHLDASLLLMPLMGFLPPDDPRVRGTVEQIKQQLGRGPLVYRYLTDDHLPSGEGAFLLCSFWLVDALAMIGEVDAARARFEQLVAYSSPHGLLAEEVDPATGTALGNYPQAFSHLGLINSALNLDRVVGSQ